MESRAGIKPADQGSRFGNGLKGTDLIIRMHDRNQDRIRPQFSFQIRKADPSVFIHRQIGHLKPLFLQILHGLKNCGMFYAGGNQMPSRPAVGKRTADQSQIIRFRSSRGEEKFFPIHLQYPGKYIFCIAKVLLSLHSLPVHTGWIAIVQAHNPGHDVCDTVKASRCG